MSSLEEISLADIVKGLNRYRPFLLVGLAAVLLIGVLPALEDDAAPSSPAASAVGDTTEQANVAPEADGAIAASDGSGSVTNTVASVGNRSTRSGTSATVAAPLSADALAAPDCDPATGRLKIPSRVMAPPCVPMWPAGANNGRATAQGVTATEIKVVVRLAQPNAAEDAAFAAAGHIGTPPSRCWPTSPTGSTCSTATGKPTAARSS